MITRTTNDWTARRNYLRLLKDMDYADADTRTGGNAAAQQIWLRVARQIAYPTAPID